MAQELPKSTTPPAASDDSTTVGPLRRDKKRGDSAAVALPADSFPGYELISEIHRGGQGVVYQAVQKSTRRTVAVKVMREGPFAGPQDKARFEREVIVLSQLNHPSIVTVHDSGTVAGNFFFVMDFIAGRPLDAYIGARREPDSDALTPSAAERRLSIDETLKLFVKICDAVNAAHLRGVIHRDLKPGNIRVSDAGHPHILDFGLAKITATPAATDETRAMLVTMTGQFVGSMPWASPEQAEGIPGKIDLRTDVYSLGVILYQLLTGDFPYAVVGNMRDVLDNIMNCPATPASALRREIDDELDTIVLKCLSKERERRYQTAGELARDIEHYLRNEPIEAKRDSGWYVLRKTLRRYRTAAAVGVAFLVLIVGSTAALSVLYRRQGFLLADVQRERDHAGQERDRAVAAELDARMAKEAETVLRQLADKKTLEAQQAQATAEAERARADQQAEQVRRNLYINQIAFAEDAYDGNNLVRMNDTLEACPADLRAWEWNRLRWMADRKLSTLRGHDGQVTAVAFSPDGQRIASAGADRVVRVWDAQTGAELLALRGHKATVNCIAFSPDGEQIASGAGPAEVGVFDRKTLCTVRLWEAGNGRLIRELPAQPTRVMALAYSPDGARLAVGCGGSRLRDDKQAFVAIWDVRSGKAIVPLPALSGPVQSVGFSPDGAHLLTCGGTNLPVQIWEANSGVRLRTIGDRLDFFTFASFSPDGRTILTCGGDSRAVLSGRRGRVLRLWDAASGTAGASFLAHARTTSSAVFSADGRRFAVGAVDGTIELWNVSTGSVEAIFRKHGDPVNSIAFSPDGTHLASGGGGGLTRGGRRGGVDDNSIRVWRLGRPDVGRLLTAHEGEARCLAVSADDRFVASAGDDGRIWITGRAASSAHAVIDVPDGAIRSITFSPDSKNLAVATDSPRTGDSGTLQLFSLEMICGAFSVSSKAAIRVIAFSPDGRFIAVGGIDGTLRLVHASDGTESITRRAHRSPISAMAFTPDGRRIVTAAGDGTARVWDSFDLAPLVVCSVPQNPISAISISPDGLQLATADYPVADFPLLTESHDPSVKIWDIDVGTVSQVLRCQDYFVTSLAWSPDGRRIAAGSADKSIHLFDPGSGLEALTLRGHEGDVRAVAFSPGGRDLISAAADGSVRVWEGAP